MNEQREAVIFENRYGQKLFGVLHRPTEGKAEVAVLLLSPGVKMRVGPHRLYNQLTQLLVAKGLTVLRFDFYGLGDSEGELKELRTPQIYNAIQNGRYVEDTLDAIDWMVKSYGCQRYVAAGLCGGAITGLLAAQQDKRIESLIGLGIPTSFEGGEADYGKFLTDGELKVLEGGYIRKLRDPKSWIRLLTLQSDFRVIFKVLRRMLRSKLGERKPAISTPAEKKVVLANTNPQFPPAFFSMLKREYPMLLLFGGADRWTYEFTEKFEIVYQAELDKLPKVYDKIVVPEANHIFSKPSWRKAMQEHISIWVDVHFKKSG